MLRWLSRLGAQQHQALRITFQYGRKDGTGKLVETYPSLAACNNDPIWQRGTGSYSVVRPLRDGEPAGKWQRSYLEDIRTLRRED